MAETEICLRFEFDRADSLDRVARELQERLGRLEMVREVEASPEGKMMMTGLEVAAAIGVTVVIVRGSRELIQEVRKLVAEIKGLMDELDDLKEVYVDVSDRRIRIPDLGDEDFRVLAEDS
jgi:hypothetical protein